VLYMYNAFCHFGRCYCTISLDPLPELLYPHLISNIDTSLTRDLEEPPIQEESDEQSNTDKGGVFPDESLEIDIPSCFSVFCRFRAKRCGQVGHSLDVSMFLEELDKEGQIMRRVGVTKREERRMRRNDSRSKLSPRHNRSSIFFVMILVTSCRFSFN